MKVEEYKGFQIKINNVPDSQFDFDGFGWSFQIFRNSELWLFRMVIKANSGKDDDINVQSSYKWGIYIIKSLIDMDNFDKGRTYCYKWNSASYPPEQVKCDGFLWDG